MENIRNFVIIAHIDSGKSTLADRLLEITGTVEARNMRPQYLDRLPLERERGITIKMAPVRMVYHSNGTTDNLQLTTDQKSQMSDVRGQRLPKSEYILNLIDTPGHSDFGYEVSRALAAVEGAILLVDATKGIQAQTLSNLRAARKAGLTIVGAVNKVDLDLPQLPKVVKATAELLGVSENEIFRVSAKTGEGVRELLEAVIERVPEPHHNNDYDNDEKDSGHSHGAPSRALIFDSLYDDHKGILAFVRVFDGEFAAGEAVEFLATGAKFKMKEAGFFTPDFKPVKKISTGEIGYIATGLKEPALVRIGDTLVKGQLLMVKGELVAPLPGYRDPAPVVFISFYPDGVTKFEDLKKGLERLRLTDAALNFEPDANEALGRGLKVGFLGQLHFEITASRLKDEFHLEFLTSFPSIAYRVIPGRQSQTYAERTQTNAEESQRESASSLRQSAILIKQPQDFPDNPEKVWQPMIKLEILTPQTYLNQVVNLKNTFDLEIKEIKNMGENLLIMGRMPLAELIRDFDDRMKSSSAGYASFSYELDGEEVADVEKLEILIVGDVVAALTRIVPRKDLEQEGRSTVERLKNLLPKEQFSQALQARAMGRIIARETIPAMKKDVTGYLYGGDRSRKMKLWKKQQRGKKKLKSMARVELSPEVFREILKK